MKKVTIWIGVMLLSIMALQVNAQSKISGKIVDEADKSVLRNATIMLLQAKDSILVDFTRADDNGKFSLTKKGDIPYLMIISYPKYGESYKDIPIKSGDEDFGVIELSSVANLIEEVLVRGKIPIVIKGDTTEYDASSFTVEKNAKVEDLLKVLPGITVDASGKITAMGKTVEKVLVDGEEFFGDDPTLVTRNIRSDMVDKVQVYEKKSEQTERTGVDDGQRIQTINVKLKEDAKNGMFGKAEAAAGTDKFYLGKAALNRFKGSQKISGFVLGANDGTVGLNWEEGEKFGLGSTEQDMDDDGNMRFTYSGDEFSRWNGKGIPRALTGGVSFSDNYKEGKHKLNFNYKYGRIENDIVSNKISQNNLLEGSQLVRDSSNNNTDNLRNRINGRYDWKLDSLTTVTIKLAGTKGRVISNENFRAQTDSAGFMLNRNNRVQNTKSNNSDFTYDGLFTRRFLKEGRSISLRLAGNMMDNNGEGNLYSTTFLNRINGEVRDTIDQFKTNENKTNNFRGTTNYTEPLSKRLNLGIGYEFNSSFTDAVNNSFNKGISGKYDVLDTKFSNNFDYRTLRNAGSISLNYKSEKFDFNVNNIVRNDDLYQRNNSDNIDLNRSFLTYNPSTNLSYKISKNKGLSFNYNRNNILPSLSQIQPLRQNTDPLNIVVGNENLKPSQIDNYRLNYHTYNFLKGSYKYLGVNFSQTHHSIQQNLTIINGISTRYFENINQTMNSANLYMGGNYNLIKKIKVEGNVHINGNYNSFYNFINGNLNKNENYNYSASIGFAKNTTKGFDFEINFTPGWRTIKTSLNPKANSDGFTFNSNSNLSYYLPLKFKLYVESDYAYEAPTQSLTEKFDRWMLKPGISKKFLKNESLAVDLYVNDVLNQNRGFSRYQAGSSIVQENYNTISRYFMFKVSWDFTSMKGAN